MPSPLDPVEALRAILLDTNVSISRRLEAAETILSFESPPDAIQEAKEFLSKIFSDEDIDAGVRLDALKLMRKAEARKVTQPPHSQPTPERAEN